MPGTRLILLAALAACLVPAATAAATRPTLQSWRLWWGDAELARGAVVLHSAAPSAAGETHSALLTSPSTARDVVFSFRARTLAQLRSGNEPNPWEVAWAMFRFRDLEHYYWFILKPNGWELGKKQGSDEQRFLRTGTSPSLRVGDSARIRIEAAGPRVRVSVDGREVVDYADPEPLLAPGSVGLYEEDARVRFDTIRVANP